MYVIQATVTGYPKQFQVPTNGINHTTPILKWPNKLGYKTHPNFHSNHPQNTESIVLTTTRMQSHTTIDNTFMNMLKHKQSELSKLNVTKIGITPNRFH